MSCCFNRLVLSSDLVSEEIQKKENSAALKTLPYTLREASFPFYILYFPTSTVICVIHIEQFMR